MAPALPAVAVLVAGAISAVRWARRPFRLTGLAVVCSRLPDAHPHHRRHPRLHAREQAAITIGPYTAVARSTASRSALPTLPGTRLRHACDQVHRGRRPCRARWLAVPRLGLPAGVRSRVNSNTFGYLAQRPEDPFVFADVFDRTGRSEGSGNGARQAATSPSTSSSPRSPRRERKAGSPSSTIPTRQTT